MTCAAIMTRDPVVVREDERIADAAQLIVSQRCVNLPVVRGDGVLVGLFGIYDLLALLVPRIAVVGDMIPNLRFLSDDMGELRDRYAEIRDQRVERAMNREPVTVYPDTALIEAIRIFCRSHMTIPVVAHGSGKLCGMISYWDAARTILSSED